MRGSTDGNAAELAKELANPNATLLFPIDYVRYNSKLIDAINDATWFLDMKDAKRKIEAWRVDYNSTRPHSSLDGRTPSEFAEQFNTDAERQKIPLLAGAVQGWGSRVQVGSRKGWCSRGTH